MSELAGFAGGIGLITIVISVGLVIRWLFNFPEIERANKAMEQGKAVQCYLCGEASAEVDTVKVTCGLSADRSCRACWPIAAGMLLRDDTDKKGIVLQGK